MELYSIHLCPGRYNPFVPEHILYTYGDPLGEDLGYRVQGLGGLGFSVFKEEASTKY